MFESYFGAPYFALDDYFTLNIIISIELIFVFHKLAFHLNL